MSNTNGDAIFYSTVIDALSTSASVYSKEDDEGNKVWNVEGFEFDVKAVEDTMTKCFGGQVLSGSDVVNMRVEDVCGDDAIRLSFFEDSNLNKSTPTLFSITLSVDQLKVVVESLKATLSIKRVASKSRGG